MTAEHLEVETSDRGFDATAPIPSEYGGAVRVGESSNAEYAGIWLWADEAMVGRPPAKVTINLTAENAWKLADQLRYLVEHHYQGDARPEEAK